MSTLIIWGLIYDIVGVFILALALATPNISDLYTLSGTYYRGNAEQFKHLMLQRLDARYGLILLVLGLVMQLLGNLSLYFAWSVEILSALIAIILVAYLMQRARLGTMAEILYKQISTDKGEKQTPPAG